MNPKTLKKKLGLSNKKLQPGDMIKAMEKNNKREKQLMTGKSKKSIAAQGLI